MLDNRSQQNSYPCRRGCGISCIGVVIWVLSSLLFLAVGTIIGAFLAPGIFLAISAIIVFAIIAFVATLITVFLALCRCREYRD